MVTIKINPNNGVNNRLPASLKLTRFLKLKKVDSPLNITRFSAISLINDLGFSVNENDGIEKDE